jgi:uncharacterized protein (TIRG00374 family)
MKRAVQILVGCAVSASMLYLAFKDFNVSALRESFDQAAWWPVLPFVAFFAVHYFFRSLRWRYLLPQPTKESPSLRSLFDAISLGNLATFLLPFRLGEFVRPLVLSRWTEYSFATCFISVVIERFFDLSAVLISFMILVQLLPNVPEWLHVAAYSLGAMAGGLLFFLVGGCLFPETISKLVTLCVRPLPAKLGRFVASFSGDLLKGAQVIKTLPRLAAIIFLTSLVWLTAYLQFNALLYMFPFDNSFLLSVALGVFVALAIALPSAPGFVGVFQIGCVAACSLFSYPVSAAQVYSLIVHGLSYVLVVVIGFWLLAVHNLNLLELKKAAETGKES